MHNEVQDFDKSSTRPEIRVNRVRDNESKLYAGFPISWSPVAILKDRPYKPIPTINFSFGAFAIPNYKLSYYLFLLQLRSNSSLCSSLSYIILKLRFSFRHRRPLQILAFLLKPICFLNYLSLKTSIFNI
jgi:hypothetical protein